MNEWLAQIYGTNGAGGADIEKTAQAMLVEKLAEAEGIDLSNLSEEDLAALASEVIPPEGQEGQVQQPMAGAPQGMAGQPPIGQQQVQQPMAGQQPLAGQQPVMPQRTFGQPQQPQQGMVAQAGGEAPSEEQVDERVKEASAKFEEADFLGRVMAHAFTQETEKIAAQKEKTAGAGEVASRAMGAARQFGGQVAGKASQFGGAAASKAKSMGGAALEHVKANKGMYGAGAGGAAAGFGAGRMSKEAAIMIEKLAEIRAGEILAENGIDPSTVPVPQMGAPQAQQQQAAPAAQAQQPQSAVAQPRQEVQQAVDGRAVELLKAAGFTFQE